MRLTCHLAWLSTYDLPGKDPGGGGACKQPDVLLAGGLAPDGEGLAAALVMSLPESQRAQLLRGCRQLPCQALHWTMGFSFDVVSLSGSVIGIWVAVFGPNAISGVGYIVPGFLRQLASKILIPWPDGSTAWAPPVVRSALYSIDTLSIKSCQGSTLGADGNQFITEWK